MQRISEEIQKMKMMHVTLHCSNALDFAGLRRETFKNLKPKNFLWKNLFMVFRHQVEIWDFASQRDYYSQINQEGFSLRTEEMTNFFENGPFLLSLFPALEKTQMDLIHTTFFPYQTILDGIVASSLYKIPSVCTPFFHFANPRYSQLSNVSLLNHYSRILACTHIEKQELTKYGVLNEKIDVIPMGVDISKFQSAQKEWFTKPYDIADDRPVVLFCGYKNYEKGAITLLQSLPQVQKAINNVLYCFIGPATSAFNYELARIKKMGLFSNILNISPSNLAGYFDKRKLGAFKTCMVYAMPSRSDAYGISFLEAWSAGKPVIGANIGATPEVVEDGVTGFLTEFDNSLAIARIITRLIRDRDLAEKLGTNGQAKVAEHNSWRQIASKISDIYEVLING